MEWKLDDSRPIWPQLKEQLIIAIVAGEYNMGCERAGGRCGSQPQYHAARAQ